MKDNKSVVAAVENAKKASGRLHLLGLVSDGGVHSHIDHLFALLKAAKHHKVPECYVHFFADGRDTSPHSGGILSSVCFFRLTQLLAPCRGLPSADAGPDQEGRLRLPRHRHGLSFLLPVKMGP